MFSITHAEKLQVPNGSVSTLFCISHVDGGLKNRRLVYIYVNRNVLVRDRIHVDALGVSATL